jgi:hypothetical protein
MTHPANKQTADFLLKQQRRVFTIDLTALDVADHLGCSEERAERVIEDMSHNCDALFDYIWNLVDECATGIPEDPIADLMDAAKKDEK